MRGKQLMRVRILTRSFFGENIVFVGNDNPIHIFVFNPKLFKLNNAILIDSGDKLIVREFMTALNHKSKRIQDPADLFGINV